MAAEHPQEQFELTPAELQMLDSLIEVRGYSPQTPIPEPTCPPAGRASASPGEATPADVPEVGPEGEGDQTVPPPED